VPYIRNQLAGQLVQASQELYEWAVEIERVKTELRIANPANSKKRWYEIGTQVSGFPSKRPIPRNQDPKAQLLLENIVPSVVVV